MATFLRWWRGVRLKWRIVFSGMFAMVILAGGVLFFGAQQGDGKVHLFFLDIGQGDAMLMELPDGETVMIDTGPDRRAVGEVREILPFLHQRIDLLLLTHFDSDHAGGTVGILEEFPVARMGITGVVQDFALQRGVLQSIADHKVPIRFVYRETDFAFPNDVLIDVLWPPSPMAGQRVASANDTSIVTRVSVRGRPVVLTTGDISSVAEAQLVKDFDDERTRDKRTRDGHGGLSAPILKVAHHGSKYSSSNDFLRAVGATYDVISVGAKNRYHHPTLEALARLHATRGCIMRTDMQGIIEIIINPDDGRVEKALPQKEGELCR